MRNLRDSKGFTLIELMIVVVIIGILAAIAIPKFTSVSDRAKQAEAGPVLKQICTLAEAEMLKTNSWPAASGTGGLGGIPGWAAPTSENFDYSYAVSGSVGIATASKKTGSTANVVEEKMDCSTKRAPASTTTTTT